MVVRIRFKGEDVGVQMKRNFTFFMGRMRKATLKASREIAADIERDGREDILSAGNFGQRWADGLNVDVSSRTGGIFGATIDIDHGIPYAGIFEKGGRIKGQPLLWLPLSFRSITIPPSQYPGGLFSAKSKRGIPLLFSKTDRRPVYFGISEVTIPRKFHIREIAEKHAKRFRASYFRHFRR